MNINKHDAQTEMEMNMTPMIDVVFLLIIFFMIITDLTQQDLEELQLPPARAAVEDKPDPKVVRPIINIPQSGKMIAKKDTKYDPEVDGDDMTRLERYLSDQSKQMPWVFDDEVGAKLPDNPLMIRSDRNTEFKYIQRIMAICGKQGIQIWKLELAAAEDEETRKAREAAEKGN
jgi:biopolymer transport protein ExbD